jgi:hypothetical protein
MNLSKVLDIHNQVSNEYDNAKHTTTNQEQFQPMPKSLRTTPLAFHSNHPTVHSKSRTKCLQPTTLVQYTSTLQWNFVDSETDLRYPLQKFPKKLVEKNS